MQRRQTEKVRRMEIEIRGEVEEGWEGDVADRGKVGSQSRNGEQRRKTNERNKGKTEKARVIVEVGEGKKDVEAENLGGNNCVPLLVTRLQSGKGAQHNADVPAAPCHVPLSS